MTHSTLERSQFVPSYQYTTRKERVHDLPMGYLQKKLPCASPFDVVRFVIFLSSFLPALESSWRVADVVKHGKRYNSCSNSQVGAQRRGLPELADRKGLIFGDPAPWGQHGLSSLWWHGHLGWSLIDLETNLNKLKLLN